MKPWIDCPPSDWDAWYREMEDLDAAREFELWRRDREFEMAGAPSWQWRKAGRR